MSAFQLNITPLKPSDIPEGDVVIKAGQELIETTKSWKQGKTYAHGKVKTFSRPAGPSDGAPWHCRLSEHGEEDATFDEFWSKLAHNKPENEIQFVHDIKKVTSLKVITDNQQIWTLYYTFPPPVSPRVFTVLQVSRLDTSGPKKSGIIVSVPIDVTGDPELAQKEEKGVKGRYVSVENLTELANGKVEWRMATSSTPGGSIPKFIAEASMPGKISDDVPHFLKWFRTVREKPTTTKADDATATAAAAEPTPAAAA